MTQAVNRFYAGHLFRLTAVAEWRSRGRVGTVMDETRGRPIGFGGQPFCICVANLRSQPVAPDN
jgi:hypothetical protein